MKKRAAALAMALALVANAVPAMAAGKVSVEQEDFYVVDSYTIYGYGYAKVENTGDRAVQVSNGLLEIYDANGDVLVTEDYLEAYAEYLQPGESTYVKLYHSIDGVEDVEEVDDYMMTITGKSETDHGSYRLPVETAYDTDVEDGWSVTDFMYALITNDTDRPLFRVGVVLALLDDEGHILYMDSENLYSSVALMPGSSILVRKEVPQAQREAYEAKGLTATTVDAIAYVDVASDVYEELMSAAAETQGTEAETEIQEAATEQPEAAATQQPEAETEQPEAETEQPEADTEQAEAETEQPVAATEQAEAETEQPETETK